MLENTKKEIRDIESSRVENVLHSIEPRIIRKHRKNIDSYQKGFQKIVFKIMKNIKKDIMDMKK
jgi:hypothetical protein